MQESKIMRQWRQDGIEKGIEEGIEKGIEKGTLTTARAAVLSVLQARFPGVPVPEGVRTALEASADARRLGEWLSGAATAPSPADFERSLSASAD